MFNGSVLHLGDFDIDYDYVAIDTEATPLADAPTAAEEKEPGDGTVTPLIRTDRPMSSPVLSRWVMLLNGELWCSPCSRLIKHSTPSFVSSTDVIFYHTQVPSHLQGGEKELFRRGKWIRQYWVKTNAD